MLPTIWKFYTANRKVKYADGWEFDGTLICVVIAKTVDDARAVAKTYSASMGMPDTRVFDALIPIQFNLDENTPPTAIAFAEL